MYTQQTSFLQDTIQPQFTTNSLDKDDDITLQNTETYENIKPTAFPSCHNSSIQTQSTMIEKKQKLPPIDAKQSK